MKPDLPIIVVSDARAVAAAISMLARRKACAVVYVEDAARGVCTIRTFFAPGHEHRRRDVDALIARSSERAGFAIVDGARLTQRGDA